MPDRHHEPPERPADGKESLELPCVLVVVNRHLPRSAPPARTRPDEPLDVLAASQLRSRFPYECLSGVSPCSGDEGGVFERVEMDFVGGEEVGEDVAEEFGWERVDRRW